ncbi:conserved hypothetical protein [Culex quinquefasciatus]|uniref:Runt domain-containing protein n=1 Tax=Culex quinquefasciatus TaxID=7176 RepID=B0XJC8_CULQU|nr:conserved hypothetical protein [Culex quinquefasciatus]|eukprot:XP_001869750.1 conserved hypothetical protein [Culex quinquefasciatus]
MPMQVATYSKAIKVTVDGPREPRSKIRHQGFHPFAFGPQRFGPDPLMGTLPFKLPVSSHFHPTETQDAPGNKASQERKRAWALGCLVTAR